ncbi:MAG: right-handed parallel beta-helix repeat-containing protein, partial [Bacteroidales bacterium]|nr:right-handed parallel beta-helix repeat-containing protein [Bacteroidales bacterium]
ESLDAAIREAREMRRLGRIGQNDTLFITLADGVHRIVEPLMLRPENSGTPQSPTIIRAEHRGAATISGGMALTGWRRATRDELRGVPERIHQQIWVADAPRVNGRIVETRQLWMGDRRLPQASLVPQDSLLPLADFNKESREITIPARYATSLSRNSSFQPWMLVHQRWAIALLRIKEVVMADTLAKITFLEPESRREFEHPWPQPVIRDTLDDGRIVSSSFNLMGNVSLLDKAGEWVQSYPDGLIYYVSEDRGGAAPSAEITIPVTSQLMRVEGTLERPVRDILFDGIRFEHTAWTTPNREGWVTLQAGFPIVDAYKLAEPGLPEKTTLENQAWIGRPESAIAVRGAERVVFGQCEFAHTGACAVDFVEACGQCAVTESRFGDIGASAIIIGHFPAGGFETHVPFRPLLANDLCHDIAIGHNQIQNVGMEDWGASAINAGYVRDVTIADNVVAGCKWSGICVGWGWTRLDSGMRNNHIVRNHVKDFGLQLHDCGAIYTLSNQPRSSIVGNRLEGMGRAPFATNNRAFYIYLDEATDGFTIRDNVMPEWRIGQNQPGKNLIIDK